MIWQKGKQNQLFFIKLKRKSKLSLSDLEIIQAQFLTGQHCPVFDIRKLKNVISEPLPSQTSK